MRTHTQRHFTAPRRPRSSACQKQNAFIENAVAQPQNTKAKQRWFRAGSSPGLSQNKKLNQIECKASWPLHMHFAFGVLDAQHTPTPAHLLPDAEMNRFVWKIASDCNWKLKTNLSAASLRASVFGFLRESLRSGPNLEAIRQQPTRLSSIGDENMP